MTRHLFVYTHLPNRLAVKVGHEPARDELGQFEGGSAGKTWRDVFNEERASWDRRFSTGRNRRAFFDFEHELGGRATYLWTETSIDCSQHSRSEKEQDMATTATAPTIDLKKAEKILREMQVNLGKQRDNAEGDALRSAEVLIEETEAALGRIADGTYGTCTSCGNEISEGRLESLPHVATCAKCARTRPSTNGLPAPAKQGEGAQPRSGREVRGPGKASATADAAVPAQEKTVEAERESAPKPAEVSERKGDGEASVSPDPLLDRVSASSAISLEVALIDPSPVNPRSKVGDVTELAKSIARYGLRHRIEIKPKPNGRFEVIDGHRRYFAVKDVLGWDVVDVEVRTRETDLESEEARLMTNLQREDLDPVEEARALKRLIEVHGRTQRDLADSGIGLSQSTISKRLGLLEMPKSVLEALDSQRITLGDIEDLNKLRSHPKRIEKVLKSFKPGSQWQSIPHLVGNEVREQKAADKAKKVRAELKAAGVSIVTDNYWWGLDYSKKARIGKGHGSLNVDLEKHQAEPCHVAWVDGTGTAQHGCSDHKRHTTKNSKSKLKGKIVGGSQTSTMSPEQREHERRRSLANKAEKGRKKFVASFLGTKPLDPQEIFELNALCLTAEDEDAGWYGECDAQQVCNFLGVNVKRAKDDSYGEAEKRALRSVVAKNPADAAFITAALAVMTIEQSLFGAQSYVAFKRYFDFLVRHGYELTEFERAELIPKAEGAE